MKTFPLRFLLEEQNQHHPDFPQNYFEPPLPLDKTFRVHISLHTNDLRKA